MGCVRGGEAGCVPRAALATRLLGTRGQSRSSSLLGSLVRAEHLPWEAPQQPPSVTDFLWPLAFGTSPPCPREEAAEGGPASIPPFSPAHSCLFTKAPKSRTHRASPRSQPCQAGKERSQLLAPPMLSKLPLPRQAGVASPGAAASSGVVGEPKELDGAGLPAAVIFAIFVITGEGQQWPLRVPGHCEGGRLALHLPELLSCMEKEPRQPGEPPAPSAAQLPRGKAPAASVSAGRGSTNAAPAPFSHPVTRYRHDRRVCH